MGYYEKLLDISKIKEAMIDEESKRLFDAKIDYMITRDTDEFYTVLDTLGKTWYCTELDNVLEKIYVKGIIIFGCGHDGIRIRKVLENCNYFPKYFCDSDKAKVGMEIGGIEVLDVEDLIKKYNDYLVILGSAKYAEEMYQFLLSKTFPAEKIFYPEYKILIAQCGNQYFDVFQAKKNEVFVDAGAYDGNTTLEFLSWSGNEYNKIYLFEPIPEMFHYIGQRMKKEQINRIELYNNALWNKREKLYFLKGDAGSRITDTGKLAVEGLSLDEVVKDQEISFIKMDIEGSELKALEGAQNTIKKNKPRLAICIYHKPEDILEVPAYILSLVPEYKFYIRHYSSCMWETVLYAEALR